MPSSLVRCLVLVTLAACTYPTEVVVQPSSSDSSASGSSSSSADGGATSCEPASAAGWSPTWVPPTGAAQGVCAAQDLANIYGACFGSDATTDSCSAYQSNNPSCASCVISDSTDSSWGAIVVFADTTVVNQPGCLDLVDSAEASCAQSAQAQSECEQALCDSSCPVTDNASLVAWQQCATEADQGPCAGYESTCLQQQLGADAGGAACAGADFPTAFTNVATVFCGSSN